LLIRYPPDHEFLRNVTPTNNEGHLCYTIIQAYIFVLELQDDFMLVVARDFDVFDDDLDDEDDLEFDENMRRSQRRNTKDSSDTIRLLFHAGKPQVDLTLLSPSHKFTQKHTYTPYLILSLSLSLSKYIYIYIYIYIYSIV
jgi:hypothetical protein